MHHLLLNLFIFESKIEIDNDDIDDCKNTKATSLKCYDTESNKQVHNYRYNDKK
ncbi:hypothetical protein JPSP37_23380 [Staphylococcus pseudintermedius]